jgi:hypothetical protein
VDGADRKIRGTETREKIAEGKPLPHFRQIRWIRAKHHKKDPGMKSPGTARFRGF